MIPKQESKRAQAKAKRAQTHLSLSAFGPPRASESLVLMRLAQTQQRKDALGAAAAAEEMASDPFTLGVTPAEGVMATHALTIGATRRRVGVEEVLRDDL